jgi:hypothetical protein
MQSVIDTIRIMHGHSPLATLLYQHVQKIQKDEGTVRGELLDQLEDLTSEGQELLEILDCENADRLIGSLRESAKTSPIAGLILRQLLIDADGRVAETLAPSPTARGVTLKAPSLERVPSAAGRRALEELVAQGSALLHKIQKDDTHSLVRTIQSTAEIAPLASALYQKLLDEGSGDGKGEELALQAVLLRMRHRLLNRDSAGRLFDSERKFGDGRRFHDGPRFGSPPKFKSHNLNTISTHKLESLEVEKALKAIIATAIATGQVAVQAHHERETLRPQSEHLRPHPGPVLGQSPGTMTLGDLDLSNFSSSQSASVPSQRSKNSFGNFESEVSSVPAGAGHNASLQRWMGDEKLDLEIKCTGASLLAPLGDKLRGISVVKTSKLGVHERRLQVSHSTTCLDLPAVTSSLRKRVVAFLWSRQALRLRDSRSPCNLRRYLFFLILASVRALRVHF